MQSMDHKPVVYALKRLTLQDGRPEYDLLRAMPSENGFMNDAFELSWEDFPAWLATQDRMSKGIDLPEGYVPQTTYWFYADGVPVGRAKLRHFLSESLRLQGGHIGYGIATPYRRRGYATAMLRLVLAEAASLGIESALVTIDEDNAGSRGVAEKCGGVLEDIRDAHCRYWIPVK